MIKAISENLKQLIESTGLKNGNAFLLTHHGVNFSLNLLVQSDCDIDALDIYADSNWGYLTEVSSAHLAHTSGEVVQIGTDLDSHDLRSVDLNQVQENRFSTLDFDDCESLYNPFEDSLTLATA